MQQQLLKNNSSSKIVMKKKEGTGAGVRLNKVFLKNSFNDGLYLETFRDVLHESKHIIDKNLFLVNLFLVYLLGALLTILIVLFALKLIVHNNLINLIKSILSITIMALFFLQTMIHITLENNAIRYVVINCNHKLKEFEFEDTITLKIYEYLSLQACYISEWYTMKLVSSLFLIYGLLIIIGF